MDTLIDLFCNVDDFCNSFLPVWHKQMIEGGEKQRDRAGKLSESEIMTLLIHFHQSRYPDFKHYYTDYVQRTFKPILSGLNELSPLCCNHGECIDSISMLPGDTQR